MADLQVVPLHLSKGDDCIDKIQSLFLQSMLGHPLWTIIFTGKNILMMLAHSRFPSSPPQGNP